VTPHRSDAVKPVPASPYIVLHVGIRDRDVVLHVGIRDRDMVLHVGIRDVDCDGMAVAAVGTGLAVGCGDCGVA
jgi:hypothetical protein